MGEKDFIAISRKSRGLSIFEQGRRGTKKWEHAMKKFTKTKKDICKAVPQEIPRVPRPEKTFATGSLYTGEWNEMGISGKGTYWFPPDENGERTIFEGEFDDGQFEGDGKMSFPSGAVLKGKWKSGLNNEPELVFPDGLEFSSQHWRYCKYPDRRYTVEYDEGLEPAGDSYITSTKPARPIPEGLYDVGYGFFDPHTAHIFSYDDLSAIVRPVGPDEQRWIKENCRTEPLEPMGPCPFLFNEWVAPMLEAEDPPIPATKTLNFLEQLLFRDESFENRNMRQWWKFGYGRQRSTSIFSIGSEGSGAGRSEESLARGTVRIASSRRQSTSHRAPLKFVTTSTTSFDKKTSFADPRRSSIMPSSIRRVDSRRASAVSISRRQSVLKPLPPDHHSMGPDQQPVDKRSVYSHFADPRLTSERQSVDQQPVDKRSVYSHFADPRRTSERQSVDQQPVDKRSVYSHFADPRRTSERQSVDQQSIRQIFDQRYPSGRQSADQQSIRQSFDQPRFPMGRSFERRQSSVSRPSADQHRQSSVTPWPFEHSERQSESDDIKVLFKHGGARSTPF